MRQAEVDGIAKIEAEANEKRRAAKALTVEAEQRARKLPAGNYLTSDRRALVLISHGGELEVVTLANVIEFAALPGVPGVDCPGFVASQVFGDVCQLCGESQAAHS